MSQTTNVREGDTGGTIPVATFTDGTDNVVQYVADIGGGDGTSDIDIDSDDSQSVLVSSASSARRFMMLTNTDPARVYLKWYAAASSSSWHFYIEPNERWETSVPLMGELNARWASGAGSGKLMGFEANSV